MSANSRILLELGRGGMGTVYLAVAWGPAGFHKLKVVKRLNPELARDPEFAKMFLDEARLAARLNHPNVVQTNEVGVDDRYHFLEMEYLEGQSLNAVQRRVETHGGLPLNLGLEIVRQALAGLHYVHELTGRGGAPLGIVHRDVSPHNLFVTYAGAVKVLDFGIAKAEDAASRTRDGVVRGKLTYMAPEQALQGRVDRRADVYAVGTILWQMLARRRLWEGLSDAQIFDRLERGALERPGAVAADVPRELEAICMRCLEHEPAARYATAEEVQNAIERAADALGLRANARDLGAWVAAQFDDLRHAVAQQIETRLAEVERSESNPEDDDLDPPVLSRPIDGDSLQPASKRSSEQTQRAVAPAVRAGRAGRARWFASSIALALLLAIGVAAAALIKKPGASAAASVSASASASSSASAVAKAAGPATVLILGIQNDTPDPVLDTTLDAVLASALRRSKRLDPFSGAKLRELAGEVDPQPRGLDEAMARRLSATTSARIVTVRGSVASAGAAFVLRLTATDAASDAKVLDETVTTAVADLVPAVGQLACALRRALGDDAAPKEPDAAGRTGVSASLDADHEWVVGNSENRVGRYESAQKHLERAIAVDPEFAQARAALAICLWNQREQTKALAELRQAFKWVDGMGDRDRLAFLGDYYSTLGDYDRAIDAYRELLSTWTHDTVASINLSVTYQQKGDMKRAVEAGRRAADEHPRSRAARSNMPAFYVTAGDFDAAVREGKAVLADFAPPPEETLENMSVADVLLGHHDDAAQLLSGLKADDAALAIADLAMYEGRLRDALDTLAKAQASAKAAKDDAATQQIAAYTARALLRVGDKEGAARAADVAMRSDEARLALLGGVVAIDAGHSERVKALQQRLAASVLPEERATGETLAAEALRAKGDARGAVVAYQHALQTFDSWLGHFGLGLAYLDLQSFGEAEAELRTCWSRRGEAAELWTPSTHLVPPVLYYLARAQEGMGDGEAQATYKELLAIEPAAQGDSLADDARHRLARP